MLANTDIVPSGEMEVDSRSPLAHKADRPIKVLSVAHSACREGSSRLRYESLGLRRDIALTLVVPKQWREYGSQYDAQISPGHLDVRAAQPRLQHLPGVKWHLHYYPGLRKLVNDLSPDVLHVWQEPWSALALQATRLCLASKRPMAVVLETEQNILHHLPFPFERIRRYTLKHADTLIYRSEEALQVSRASGFAGPSAKVSYCVDTRYFHPQVRSAVHNVAPPAQFTVGYVGRLIPEKGLFCLVDALQQCGPDVHAAFMGAGPALPKLKEKVASAGLEKRVRFFNPRPPQEVAAFMSSLDALSLLSLTTSTWKEQFGRVIVEAQACGVPVIGSTSGSIPDVIGTAGWIVPENDSGSLAALLMRLSTDPDEVRRKASATAQNLERFASDTVSNQLWNAYKSALTHRYQLAGN